MTTESTRDVESMARPGPTPAGPPVAEPEPDDAEGLGTGPAGDGVVVDGAPLPPPAGGIDELPPPDGDALGGEPEHEAGRSVGPTTAEDPDDQVLIGVSFEQRLRAQEFLLAVTRLRENGALGLRDAVVVGKGEDGRTRVIETADLSTGQAALSGALWTGLLGLLVGGPVGWLAGIGVGAGAGAVAAKVIDIGVPDEWVDWFKEAVRPGTSTVVVLADHVDIGALEAEARRFTGAELLHTTLSASTWAELQAAFDGG